MHYFHTHERAHTHTMTTGDDDSGSAADDKDDDNDDDDYADHHTTFLSITLYATTIISSRTHAHTKARVLS